MIRSPKMNKICIGAAVLAVILAVALMAGGLAYSRPSDDGGVWDGGGAKELSGKDETESAVGVGNVRDSLGADGSGGYISTEYATRLFDDSYVHEIDILVPEVNWQYMVSHAEDEVYVLCNARIDGELVENIAIRPKGNSSLSAMAAIDSDRFSFKIEFDHYRADNTYYGLDKLALNNLSQDVSCMKDFLTYHMMNEMGVAAPLSSYVNVRRNGEDFGLYLAVEAIEDSFAWRNYGADYGNIYKPECFAMADISPEAFMDEDMMAPMEGLFEDVGPGDRVDILGTAIRMPFEKMFGSQMDVAAMKYVGDDVRSYDIIFDASVFDVEKADKERFVRAVKTLNTSDDAMDSLDVESLLRYFIVHNFVNNYDGYTGIFVHNYYVREADGRLSMIPWDYNLSFGIFTFESAVESFLGADGSPYGGKIDTGGAMSDAMSMVNYPIDTPTITVDLEERPLISKLLEDEEGMRLYHRYYGEFLDMFFTDGRFEELYDTAWKNIRPYIEDGQTLYTFEQAEKGAKAVHDYCVLRAQSIAGQLDGSIPATMEGQSADYGSLVDTGDLHLADSVTFDGLVAGIRSQDVIAILDAVAGEGYEHDMGGVENAILDAMEEPGRFVSIARRILTSSTLLQRLLHTFLLPPTLFVASAVALIVAVRRVGKYRRRVDAI